MNNSIINNFLSSKEYKIALVVCADDGYINNEFATTAIKSFLFHNKWFEGDIIFFDDKKFFTISEENKQLLKSICNKVIFKEIDYSKYEYIINSFLQINDNNKNFLKAYPKFEIFNLLNEYDKILCIDGDILFVDNIKDLFEQDITLGVTSSMLFNHYFLHNIKINKYIKYNNLIDLDSGGFNSGVLYLGNKQLKNITNNIIFYTKNNVIKNYYTNNKKIMFFDQCILCYFFNEYFNKYVEYINPKYNFVIFKNDEYNIENINNIYLLKIFKNVKILHYIFKPNGMENDIYFKKIWNFYKDISIDIINNYGQL